MPRLILMRAPSAEPRALPLGLPAPCAPCAFLPTMQVWPCANVGAGPVAPWENGPRRGAAVLPNPKDPRGLYAAGSYRGVVVWNDGRNLPYGLDSHDDRSYGPNVASRGETPDVGTFLDGRALGHRVIASQATIELPQRTANEWPTVPWYDWPCTASQGPASVGPGPRLLQLRLPPAPTLSFGMAPRQGAILAPGPVPPGLQRALVGPEDPGLKRPHDDMTPAGPGDPDVIKAIELQHRMKREKRGEFSTDRERSEYAVGREVEALTRILPGSIRLAMMGGPAGVLQVPCLTAQDGFISRLISSRAGTEGAKIASVRLALGVIRCYGASILGESDPEKRDELLFPMSGLLTHELIHKENLRALEAAKGKKKGASVGPKFRDTLIFMSEKLRMPICVERDYIFAAAPKATAGGGAEKAGTLPIAVKCHLEELAFGAGLPDLSDLGNLAVTFYARTFLVANLDQSVRLGEGIRIEIFPDETSPDTVIRGTAWMGKDGAPLALYAPAEGLLGPYTWYREHLARCLELGQVYPKWVRPKKSGGLLSKAGALKTTIADKSEVRRAFKDILMLPPLNYSEKEITEWALRGHSMHATYPDWARALGRLPNLSPPLPGALREGFLSEDVGCLGLWQRDAGAKAEATAEQAAREAQGRDTRLAAARAAVGGLPASRGLMQNYYGMAGAAPNRFSERFNQLRVRQRLIHSIRHVLGSFGNWRTLPRGPSDIEILRSSEI